MSVIAIVVLGLPAIALVFAIWRRKPKEFFWETFMYARGALVGGVVFVTIAEGLGPMILSAFRGVLGVQRMVVTKVLGTELSQQLRFDDETIIGIIAWYLGLAAGVWIVWWIQRKTSKKNDSTV
jgi:hypothetical protein